MSRLRRRLIGRRTAEKRGARGRFTFADLMRGAHLHPDGSYRWIPYRPGITPVVEYPPAPLGPWLPWDDA